MKTQFVLIHGIRKRAFSQSHMNDLREQLLSLNKRAISVNYGYILIPVTNKRAVTKSLELIQPYIDNGNPITLVGYSNGGWTATQIAEMGYPIDRLVLISPALHSMHAFPEQLRRIDVYWCPTDMPTKLAKAWRKASRVFPMYWGEPHGWGKMGATGYQGDDPRVLNHKLPDYVGHTFFEHEEIVDKIAREIAEGDKK